MSDTLELLIVEDEADRRSLLSQIFTQRGFQVRAAEDGFAALRMIRSSMPDLLLSDLNMPGMSGFELLSVVRRRYPQICVIATSGAYCGPEVPAGIAADGFHEKATGMARLFELAPVLLLPAQADSVMGRSAGEAGPRALPGACAVLGVPAAVPGAC